MEEKIKQDIRTKDESKAAGFDRRVIKARLRSGKGGSVGCMRGWRDG